MVTNNAVNEKTAATGKILQGQGVGVASDFSTATYPSVAGTSGKVLVSDGTNVVFSTPTFPNASAGSGKFIQSDGTNWVASTPTLPTSAGTSGKILQSNGTNYVESTPTYPSASGSTGVILRSDGTNNVYTTATYPATTTLNQILYSSVANTITGLATATNGVLITDGTTGIPSISSTLPSAVQGNITTVGTITSGTWAGTTITVNHGGTGQTTLTNHGVLVGAGTTAITQLAAGLAGQVLQSGGASADPGYSTATYPTTATGTGTILRADGTNWVATTATYPATTTSQQILYSTADNVVGQLTTANSKFPATNSSGTLAMRALSVVRQVFTTTGTYTPTTGMIYCDIICIGGGGAGAGAAATGGATVSVGAGGGAGEYAQGTFSAATIGASKSVTIGAAGAGASGALGGNGGNTSVGSTTISANGGTGGAIGATAGTSNCNGGAGGTGGTGGDFRLPGQPGFWGFANLTNPTLLAGVGGSSQYGAGGKTDVTLAANQGLAGTGNGSGGGGCSNYINQAAALTGGAGTKGIVIITEYVIA